MHYVAQRYRRCIAVFDGYCDGPSVKDAAHLRRESTNAVAVHCDHLSTLTVKKDVVLRNEENKQCFINIVSEKLKEAVCDSIHAAGDADVLIVQSAVSVAATRDTVVIADDTDILIVFCERGKNCKTANQSRNEGSRKARFGTSRLLVLCSGQTSADIFQLYFYTRCWDTIPGHACLVLERPSVLRIDHSCISMPKYFTYNANSLKEDVMKAERALVEV